MATLPPSLLDVNPTADRQPEILRATIPFVILTFVAVILRFWSRRLKRAAVAADDYMILAALFSNVCDFVLTCIVIHHGAGKHLIAVPQSNYIPFLKTLFAFEILYTTTISTAKLSILLFYRRIFETPVFRQVTQAVGFVVLAWFLAVVLVSIFSCTPIHGYWDHSIPATCIDSRAFYLGNSIANILTDVIILALPVRMIWHLQTSRSQKVALTLVFGLGGFVVVVSSIRIAFIIEVGPDFTWDYTNPIIWSDIEISIAVVCACLPTLRPVAQYAVSGLSSIKSRYAVKTSESVYRLQDIPANESHDGPLSVRRDHSKPERSDHRQDEESVVQAG